MKTAPLCLVLALVAPALLTTACVRPLPPGWAQNVPVEAIQPNGLGACVQHSIVPERCDSYLQPSTFAHLASVRKAEQLHRDLTVAKERYAKGLACQQACVALSAAQRNRLREDGAEVKRLLLLAEDRMAEFSKVPARADHTPKALVATGVPSESEAQGPAKLKLVQREDLLTTAKRIAVINRLKGFSMAEAFNPKRVAEAFRKTPAELWLSPDRTLSLKRRSRGKKLVSVEWTQYVAHLTSDLEERRQTSEHWKPGAPGLVWGLDEGATTTNVSALVLVNADGAVVRIHPRTKFWFEFGAARSLPPLKPHGVLGSELHDYEKAGLIAEGSAAAARKDKQRLQECQERIVAAAEGQFEVIRQANITYSTRENRLTALEYRVSERARQACNQHRLGYLRKLLAASKHLNAARRELATTVRGLIDRP